MNSPLSHLSGGVSGSVKFCPLEDCSRGESVWCLFACFYELTSAS